MQLANTQLELFTVRYAIFCEELAAHSLLNYQKVVVVLSEIRKSQWFCSVNTNLDI
jgi:hypothetical protein